MKAQLKIPQFIRCVCRNEDSLWVAFSLEFGLAAQGDSESEAREKLEKQIVEYIGIALSEEGEYQAELFRRKAPIFAYLIFYKALLLENG